MKNKYDIKNNIVTIYLHRKNGDIYESYFDLEDFEKVNKHNVTFYAKYYKDIDGFYAVATIYGGKISEGKYKYSELRLHKLILNYFDKDDIDHINHDTLDNRKENLRILERNKNTKHRKTKNSNNTSGYRNVCWDFKRNKWIVQLQINGKNTTLGEFDDLIEGGKFAEKMRQKYYKEFAGGE